MPQNQFELFAAGAGANTLTPTAFAAQNYLAQGFQNGVAQAYDINTVLRQLSTITTALAQFTADHQAADVLDDGSVSNFEAKFTAALQGALASSSVHIAVASGTGDAMVANAAPALVASAPGVYAPAVVFVRTPAQANATTAPTFNGNSIGNIVVTKRDGSVTGGADIPGHSWIILLLDGAGGCFLAGGLAPSDVSAASSLGGKLVGCTDATQLTVPNTILLTGSPSIGGYSLGQTFIWVPTTTITGLATLNVDGKGQLALKRPDGSPSQANDVVAGRLTQASYDINGNARLHSVPTTATAARADTCFAHGQCRLSYSSSNTIILSPANGNNVIVNGAQIQIPIGGVSGGIAGQYVNGSAAANQSLAALTAYYVTLAVIGGVPTLRYWNASAYGHMPDATAGNIGIEVVANGTSPISTDTLVGMIYTSASFTFQDTAGARYTLSWFNRRRKASLTSLSAARSTTSTSFVELGSEIRNGFISWADETVRWVVNGSYTTSASTYCGGQTAVSFDSVSSPETNIGINQPFQNPSSPAFLSFEGRKTVSEGSAHYATLLGLVQGNTGTWAGGNAVLWQTAVSAMQPFILQLEVMG